MIFLWGEDQLKIQWKINNKINGNAKKERKRGNYQLLNKILLS